MPQLPIHDGPAAGRSKKPLLLALLAAPLLLLFAAHTPLSISPGGPPVHDLTSDDRLGFGTPQCPKQPAALRPKLALGAFSAEYREAAAGLLSEAVRIPSVSYDDNGTPAEDPRWAPFFDFQKWLLHAFPAVFEHEATTVEYVNTLGVVTTIQGSEPSLKPLMLMSHYDVTPVPPETVQRWTHGPFSGFNDGEYIWGRGASDDKTLLVAQYQALSLLLADKTWTPRRTIILAHGMDEEEVGVGRQGAVEIGKHLLAKHGRNSMLLVIDEGTTYADGFGGVEFAGPGSSEEGYLDVRITVGTKGGHSSVPFVVDRNSIVIMAELVLALQDNPYPNDFLADDPLLAYLACAAEHAPRFPQKWRRLLEKGGKAWLELADEFAALGPMQHALVTTTTAIDVISGGSKVNSLPEEVELQVNHRIQFSSSVNATKQHIAAVLAPLAEKYGLKLSAFDGADGEELGEAYVRATVMGVPLEPAPRSLTAGGVWDLFAGSIKHAFPTDDGSDRVVTPFAGTGNTDTKAMHPLSRSIFRFKGEPEHGGGFAHTVDERASIDGHLGIINWIHTIVQNADAYTGDE